VVVLLTDGEDTTSRTGWSVAERFAHTMRVPIFPIGLGLGSLDFSSRGVLKSLAAETGGEAFFPKSVEELPAVYARIAELLRSQYLLWYPSPSSKPSTSSETAEGQAGPHGADDPRLLPWQVGRPGCPLSSSGGVLFTAGEGGVRPAPRPVTGR
jgi:hypothetical protein